MDNDPWDEDEDQDDDGDDGDEESTIPCPYCRREIYEDSERCPYCGEYILEEDIAPAHKPWWIVLGVLLAFGVIFWWIWSIA